MTTVRKLLADKERTGYISLSAADTVLHALKVMTESKIGAVLVTENNKIVGIYTERDYLRKGELDGRVAKDTLIRDVMTPKMVTVNKDTSVEECSALMKQYQIRHLPVVDATGAMVGMISIGDLVRAVIEEQQETIVQLERFISG